MLTIMSMEQTAAARAKRTKIKHDRWAAEMAKAGWFCHDLRRDDTRKVPGEGMDVYAINWMREVYRVIGWQMDGRPELDDGRGGSFIGTGADDYLYAIGAAA